VSASELVFDPSHGWSRLQVVPTRVSSSSFVGRRAELAALEETWKTSVNDQCAGVVLIAGEAGVGKSRLVTELGARLAEPSLVLVGQCFDLAERALPFGPIVQVLRTLHRNLDQATLDAIVGPARDELAALLPELGAPAREGIVSAALFEQLLGLFERLSERVPTLLVLEDLHWADRSTRELFAYLARSLRCASMVLVGTYRSDDLHRRHPLRGLVAELDRSGAVERIDLQPFDLDEVRELIASIRGAEPSVALVDRTFTRSDGNVFFAEELLTVDDDTGRGIPPTLREIVLARVDGLSDRAQRMLRSAAVIGRSADHRLLEAIAGVPHDELLEAAREAVAEHILVPDAEGLEYHFRHALVREAVNDDLLPGDRVALHTRVAEVLTEHPEWMYGGPTQLYAALASHWDAARNAPHALAAALNAARAAERIYAYGDALEHAEHALALWTHVPDAEELVGIDHVALLRYAATQAEMAGVAQRALDYIEAALTETDADADPVTAGLLHERYGRYLWMLGRSWNDILEHCRHAVELVPDEPSEARAKVVATLGQQLMLAGDLGAIAVCEDAIKVAQAAGDRVIEGHARNSLGSTLTGIGRMEEGLAELNRSRELAFETCSWTDVARAATNEGAALQTMARDEDALAIWLEGAEVARAHGLDRACGLFLRLNAVESLLRLGRWADADVQLGEVRAANPEGIDEWRLAELESRIAVGRGRLELARDRAAKFEALLGPPDAVRNDLAVDHVHIVIDAWSGDEHGALRRAQEALGRPVEGNRLCNDVSLDVILDGLAAGASAVLHTSDGEARAAELQRLGEVGRALDDALALERWGGARPGALDALQANVAAECARAIGTDGGDVWVAVAQLWDGYGMRPRSAYARFRAAEAFVRDDDRRAATVSARDAFEAATEIGWIFLRDAIASLARRARLDLGKAAGTASSPADRFGLTARELDVLALLGEGRTNRQVADTLFISVKTASVHVSNILAKLGVANRGEAGAAARRLGLDVRTA
jgi:DNA-binding CsgD family transcriptional regulator/tetratricopeptide (TPR) repeat protein